MAAAVIRRLFGASGYSRLVRQENGVIHTMSAVNRKGLFFPIKIDENSPKSSIDFFVLNLCRSMADYVITTGEILRTEPEVTTRIQGEYQKELSEWRRTVRTRDREAIPIVLSRSQNLDYNHALFKKCPETLVYNGCLNDLIPSLAFKHPCLITVEAGPSASSAIYRGKSCPDLLFISEYRNYIRDSQIVDSPKENCLSEDYLRSEMRCVSVNRDSDKDFNFYMYERITR
ncbi:hypothetical protein AAMO2058_001736700 [Amorphochlora amoebiformis]